MKEALKLALEALKLGDTVFYPQTSIAIAAIEKELAQQEQEPVAWLDKYGEIYKDVPEVLSTDTPLYTTLPQRTWAGLTDEEIDSVFQISAYQTEPIKRFSPERFAQAIEAKLKEKNT